MAIINIAFMQNISAAIPAASNVIGKHKLGRPYLQFALYLAWFPNNFCPLALQHPHPSTQAGPCPEPWVRRTAAGEFRIVLQDAERNVRG